MKRTTDQSVHIDLIIKLQIIKKRVKGRKQDVHYSLGVDGGHISLCGIDGE